MAGKGRYSPFGGRGGSPRLVMAGSVLVMGAVGVVSAVSLDGISLGSHDAPPTASGPVEGIGPQAVGPQPVGPQVVPPPAAAEPGPAVAAPALPDPTAGLPAPGSSGSGGGTGSGTGGSGGGTGQAAPERSSPSSGSDGGRASTPTRTGASHSAPADRRIGRFTGNNRPAVRATDGRTESDDSQDGDDGDDSGTESRRDRDARRVAHACQVAAQVFDGPWDAEDCVQYVGRHRASN